MPPKLTRAEDCLEIDLADCKGPGFQDALAKTKELPGRRWSSEKKVWELPLEAFTAERALRALGAETDDATRTWITDARREAEKDLVTPLPEDADDLKIEWAYERTDWQPKEINGEPFHGLMPHQRALVSKLVLKDPVRAIVADSLGLGKTATAISTVFEFQERHDTLTGPKLIICPNSVKGVWSRELDRWLCGPTVRQIEGDPRKRMLMLEEVREDNGWAIINWEQLRVEKKKVKTRAGGQKTVTRMKQPLFQEIAWEAAIADEAHRAKNRKAAQSRGLHRVQAQIQIALTGTPIMNEPSEIWSLLHWLFPKEYTSYWRFYEQYVDYVDGFWGKQIVGVKNPDHLRFELHGKLYRRTKDDVLDLPEKQRITVPVILGPTQRKLYAAAEKQLWLEVEKEVEEGDQNATRMVEGLAAGRAIYQLPNGAARTVRLRQILSTPALLQGRDDSAKLDAVESAILDNADKQHVVFSEFVETCHLLADRLRRHNLQVACYTGEVKPGDRTSIEDTFQQGELDVVVGTIGAMKEGITLTASDTVHFIERAWVPGWNEQAEDRVHRIGQRNHVTVYIYEAVNTIDDGKVSPTNKLKEAIVKTILPQEAVL